MIDPKSIAGCLLREFDSVATARHYAERIARSCHVPKMAEEYACAAIELSTLEKGNTNGKDQGHSDT